jgi:hypothetical protein
MRGEGWGGDCFSNERENSIPIYSNTSTFSPSYTVHRARLFPLPLLEIPFQPPHISNSARIRFRFKCRRIAVDITNRCITTLNHMYQMPPLLKNSNSPSFSKSNKPDNYSNFSPFSSSFSVELQVYNSGICAQSCMCGAQHASKAKR